FTAIVQKNVTDPLLLSTSSNSEFIYVAKQMLPSPAGITIPSDLPAGQTYNAPELIWDNPNGDAIVVFVQAIEGNDKNVYQAQLVATPPLPDVVTGIEPLLADQIKVYPNPANDEVNIILPEPIRSKAPLKMFDTF